MAFRVPRPLSPQHGIPQDWGETGRDRPASVVDTHWTPGRPADIHMMVDRRAMYVVGPRFGGAAGIVPGLAGTGMSCIVLEVPRLPGCAADGAGSVAAAVGIAVVPVTGAAATAIAAAGCARTRPMPSPPAGAAAARRFSAQES